MYDIIFISNHEYNAEDKFNALKTRFPLAKRASSLSEARKRSFTKIFWIVFPDITLLATFNFDYKVTQWDEQYIHVFKNGEFYDGVCLMSKTAQVSDREFNSRFYIDKKEVDIHASTPDSYEIFYVDTYEEYKNINSNTDMFWVVRNDLLVEFDFLFQIQHCEKQYVHVFKNGDFYDGIALFPMKYPVTEKEFNHRFYMNTKEVPINVSKPKSYDMFNINSYDEYLTAMENSTTDLFWIIPAEINIEKSFDFGLYFSHHNIYDRSSNHVFLNGKYYDGVMLLSKNNKITAREFNNRFLVERKEWDILASTPKLFDIVFISYNEPYAADNYNDLVNRYKNRTIHSISGVTGIHQAHKSAAEKSTTAMFWVVDADAKINDDFNFDYQVSKYDNNIVHVWKSLNPINELTYGYGGVKLLPRELTLKVDNETIDMTTSISSKFKVINEVSNTTAFNTDPFSTWKSAFRECVKLSSKIIIGQDSNETEERLNIWCSNGINKKYGSYSIMGANDGKSYGQKNAGDIPALSRINDFDWLLNQFNGIYQIDQVNI